MKTAILILVASLAAFAAPGTVVTGSNRVVTATAGSIICTFQLRNSNTKIHTVCTVSGSTALTQDVTPALSAGSGGQGTFQMNGNTVGWVIWRSSGSAISYQIAANGTLKASTF